MDVEADGTIYTGKVKVFKANNFMIITPNDDLSEAGVKNNKVEASVSDIFTEESPVYLQKEQEVEFKLVKDEYGVYANFVSGPGGAEIENEEVPEQKEQPARKAMNGGQTYNGKVKAFNGGAGFGFVVLDEDSGFELADDVEFDGKEKFVKQGAKKLWFHRNDIQSTDPAVGVANGDDVQFSIYTDSKGIGAQGVAQRSGAPISGYVQKLRRAPKKKKKKRKADQMQNMQGGMRMMGGMQIVMMNGIPYMMMPVAGAGGKKKKRKKNKKKSDDYNFRDGDWKCDKCQYDNWNRREVCNECGEGKRPADLEIIEREVVEREMQEGDWKCSSCDFHNFAKRTTCRECSTAKEGGEATGMDADETSAL